MKILGAIIAGGQASRFGADKPSALLRGMPLAEHVARALRGQCENLVIVGCDWPGLTRIEDRPHQGEGPLGGLNGALHHAAAHSFDAVLCAGCDTLPVPPNLTRRLSPGPAVVDNHWLLGLWPSALAGALDSWLNTQADRSIRGFMRHVGARHVPFSTSFVNINTPEALAEAEKSYNPQSK